MRTINNTQLSFAIFTYCLKDDDDDDDDDDYDDDDDDDNDEKIKINKSNK